MGIHLQFKHQRNITMNCFKVLALIVGVCSTASIGEERESYGKQKLQCQPLQPATDSQYTYIEPGKMYQLESPNYPEFYPNNEECAFQFVSDGTIAYDAAFWCENFDIQGSEDCVKDNIEFWADTEDAPLRICNSNYEGGFINLPSEDTWELSSTPTKKELLVAFPAM